MELFPPNGGFVRLQSRERRGKYVHADGGWLEVSLRALGGGASPLEAVWRVERVAVIQDEQEVVFLHLQNVAYGRYLSFSPAAAPSGHRGRHAYQSDRNQPPNNLNSDDFVLFWRAERVHPGQDYVRLRCGDTNFDLRANGKHCWWRTGVTIDENRRHNSLTTMMQWTVHHVPESPVPVPLPLPAAPPQPQQVQGGGRGLLFWRRSGRGVRQPPARTIRHVRATNEGNLFDQNHLNWPSFTFTDDSMIALRLELGLRLEDWDEMNHDVNAYTLCMRPGLHGRLMPLLTHLPRSLDPVSIVVLRTGSPAAAALVYPEIAAPAQ